MQKLRKLLQDAGYSYFGYLLIGNQVLLSC